LFRVGLPELRDHRARGNTYCGKACVRCLGTGPSDVPSEIRLRRKSL